LFRKWQGLEQDSVHKAEERGGHADAERKYKSGEKEELGMPSQGASSLREIIDNSQQSTHEAVSVLAASLGVKEMLVI
jgi:hypothetical protein